MGEFTKEDRERLVRVEDAVTTIKDFMKTAASDQGFPRCAARKIKWDQVEKHQKKVESFITWFYRSIVGATILAVITIIWSHIDKFEKVTTTLP